MNARADFFFWACIDTLDGGGYKGIERLYFLARVNAYCSWLTSQYFLRPYENSANLAPSNCCIEKRLRASDPFSEILDCLRTLGRTDPTDSAYFAPFI